MMPPELAVLLRLVIEKQGNIYESKPQPQAIQYNALPAVTNMCKKVLTPSTIRHETLVKICGVSQVALQIAEPILTSTCYAMNQDYIMHGQSTVLRYDECKLLQINWLYDIMSEINLSKVVGPLNAMALLHRK